MFIIINMNSLIKKIKNIDNKYDLATLLDVIENKQKELKSQKYISSFIPKIFKNHIDELHIETDSDIEYNYITKTGTIRFKNGSMLKVEYGTQLHSNDPESTEYITFDNGTKKYKITFEIKTESLLKVKNDKYIFNKESLKILYCLGFGNTIYNNNMLAILINNLYSKTIDDKSQIITNDIIKTKNIVTNLEKSNVIILEDNSKIDIIYQNN
ncbi:hypothetical protein QKC54_gp0984 [Megavirus baoshan]|uniref:Uncharacterized protein n=1 Tax=Megavirus baoshan TaxID=2496520 RepID=A0A8K1W674_9VIRU|nr:hypothetical protein QKC54_gp0984 [Megavirus baoshan]UFX99729.1 hypothetical protein Mb0088 [Megavirus baoshan]